MVTQRGIEVNLTKIRAVLDLKSLWTIKKVQSLTGGITALNRSISQSMEKRHPFSDIRKKKKKKVIILVGIAIMKRQIKEYLENSLTLAKPILRETLLLHLAISEHAVSTLLVSQCDKNTQKPVYYVNKVFADPETRYPLIEMLTLALIVVARKL